LTSRNIRKAEVIDKYFNYNAILPYGLKVEEIRQAMIDTYEFLYRLNKFLLDNGYERLEDLILGNSLSGIISEILVKNISNNSATLIRNKKVGGHPDLIPRGRYPNDETLHGEGIEIKSSKQEGGWQGHNPEKAWVMIFRYILDKTDCPPEERDPITFVQVLAAELEENDWGFSGRRAGSRRTITASIKASGMDKLRSNPVYQHPDYIVAPNKKLYEKYAKIVKLQKEADRLL
jgi:hypothetical protein